MRGLLWGVYYGGFIMGGLLWGVYYGGFIMGGLLWGAYYKGFIMGGLLYGGYYGRIHYGWVIMFSSNSEVIEPTKQYETMKDIIIIVTFET